MVAEVAEHCRVTARNSLTEHVVAALGRNEFILYRQAIVPLTGDAGQRPFHEVLIRFREEEDKLLPPGMFVPVLERHGLMRLLDRWVVGRVTRTVCEARARHPDAPVPRFSINLSADTLHDERFAPHVRDSVRSGELPETTLSFEVIQDTALAHAEVLAGLLARLRPAGCRFVVARCDGGDQVCRLLDVLRPDLVKISPGVVRAMERRPADTAPVEAIARRCRSMGIGTIAEHVENSALLTHLRGMGIDYAQGFGVEPPGRLV